MDWLSPYIIGLTIFIVVLAVVVGRLRHEPPRAIFLNAVGYPLSFLALGWAGSTGDAAFGAAAAASLGAILFTMGHYQADRAKREAAARRELAASGR